MDYYKNKNDRINQDKLIQFPHLAFTKFRPTRPEFVHEHISHYTCKLKNTYILFEFPTQMFSHSSEPFFDHTTATDSKLRPEFLSHGLVEQRQPGPQKDPKLNTPGLGEFKR